MVFVVFLTITVDVSVVKGAGFLKFGELMINTLDRTVRSIVIFRAVIKTAATISAKVGKKRKSVKRVTMLQVLQ